MTTGIVSSGDVVMASIDKSDIDQPWSGSVRAVHLPVAIDRLHSAIVGLLHAMPEFDGGAPLVDRLAEEMALLRLAAREACHLAGIPWTSQYEHELMQRELDRKAQKAANPTGGTL